MKFFFEAEPDGGEPFRITASARDVVAWERGGKDRTIANLISNGSLVDWYALAHVAARRQGLFDGSLQEFEKSVDLAPTDNSEDTPAGEEPPFQSAP